MLTTRPHRTTGSVDVYVPGNTNMSDLSLDISASNVNPDEGDAVTIYVDIADGRPDVATGIAVQMSLPAGLEYTSALFADYESSTQVFSFPDLNVAPSSYYRAYLYFNVIEGTANTVQTVSAEIVAATQDDPNSVHGNNVPAEDDQDSGLH